MIDDQEAELEEKACECLTVEQNILSLEREIADHYKEIQAIRTRGYAPHEIKHRDRALLMFEKGIEYNARRISELQWLRAYENV
jgi:hypothetical protein